MTIWLEVLREVSKPLGFALAGGVALAAVGWFIYFVSERRVLVRLGRRACPSCGQSFGFSAARDAKCRYRQECAKEYAEILRKHDGGVLVNFDCRWEVQCPHCHQTTMFHCLRETLEHVA